MTFSEELFQEFCRDNGIECTPVPTTTHRTPDFELRVGGTLVACEVKQVEPNPEDLSEVKLLDRDGSAGRWLKNRLTRVLEDTRQLKAASTAGRATLLAIYDNTPFKTYTMHSDVVQAMLGRETIRVSIPSDPAVAPIASPPFFGADRGVTPTQNTSVSAIGILDGGPIVRPLRLRVYHNPYARVRLDPVLFESFSTVTQPLLPDAGEIRI